MSMTKMHPCLRSLATSLVRSTEEKILYNSRSFSSRPIMSGMLFPSLTRSILAWNHGTGSTAATYPIVSSISVAIFNPTTTTQVRGFKEKATLQLRCKDCYYKKVDYRWWVLCPTHPRHRQREVIDDIKRKWIMTHMTIGGRPFQKKEEAYICNLVPPGPYDYRPKMFFKPDPRNVVIPKKKRPGLHQKLFRHAYNEPN